MDWTDEGEKHVMYIGDCARGHYWMYNEERKRLVGINEKVSKIMIVLPLISGLLNTIALSLGVQAFIFFIIASNIIEYCSSTVNGIINHMNYDEKISEYKHQLGKFLSLYHNTRRQLSLPMKDREPYTSYVTWISKNYDDLIEMSSDVSSEIVSKYEVFARQEALPVPGDINKRKRRTTEETLQIIKDKYQGSHQDEKLQSIIVDNKTLKEINQLETVTYSDEQMKYELNRLNGSS